MRSADQHAQPQVPQTVLGPPAQPSQTTMDQYADQMKNRSLDELNKAIDANPRNFQARCRRGTLLKEQGNLQAAKEDYQEALKIFPKSVAVLCMKGVLCEQMGNKEGAIQEFNLAVQYNPDSKEACYHRGRLFAALGLYPKALIDLTKVITKYPDDFQVYLERASVYTNINMKDKAIEDYSKVIILDPRNFSAYFGRGKLKRSLEDLNLAISLNANSAAAFIVRAQLQSTPELAIRDYNEGLRLDGNNMDALLARAVQLGKARNLQKGIDDCTTVINAQPMNSLAYSTRASYFNEMGNHKAALDDFSKAEELGIRTAELYRNKANIFVLLGEQEKALEYINKAIQINPQSAQNSQIRANIRIQKKDYEEALSDYDMIIRLDPKNHEAYFNRGKLYSQLNQRKRAITDFDEAIRLQPNSIKPYHERGLCYFSRGGYQNALADFSKSIELNPRYGGSIFYRAITYGHLNQPNQALEDFKHAINLDANRVENYEHRGKLYRKMGKFDKAIEDFDRAIALEPTNFLYFVFRAGAYIAGGGKPETYQPDLIRAIDLTKKPLAKQYIQQALAILDYDQIVASYEKIEPGQKSNFHSLAGEIVDDYLDLATKVATMKVDGLQAIKAQFEQKQAILQDMRIRLDSMEQSTGELPKRADIVEAEGSGKGKQAGEQKENPQKQPPKFIKSMKVRGVEDLAAPPKKEANDKGNLPDADKMQPIIQELPKELPITTNDKVPPPLVRDKAQSVDASKKNQAAIITQPIAASLIQSAGKLELKQLLITVRARLVKSYEEFTKYLNQDNAIKDFAKHNPAHYEYAKALAKLLYLQVKGLILLSTNGSQEIRVESSRQARDVLEMIESIAEQVHAGDTFTSRLCGLIGKGIEQFNDTRLRQLQKRIDALAKDMTDDVRLTNTIVSGIIQLASRKDKQEQIAWLVEDRGKHEKLVAEKEVVIFVDDIIEYIRGIKKEIVTGLLSRTIPKVQTLPALVAKDFAEFMDKLYDFKVRPRQLIQVIQSYPTETYYFHARKSSERPSPTPILSKTRQQKPIEPQSEQKVGTIMTTPEKINRYPLSPPSTILEGKKAPEQELTSPLHQTKDLNSSSNKLFPLLTKVNQVPQGMSYFRNLAWVADERDDVYLVLQDGKLVMHNKPIWQWRCIHKKDSLYSIHNDCTGEWLIVAHNRLKVVRDKQAENFTWQIKQERGSSEELSWSITPSTMPAHYLSYREDRGWCPCFGRATKEPMLQPKSAKHSDSHLWAIVEQKPPK